MNFTTLTKKVLTIVLPVFAVLFTAPALFAQAPANDDVCSAVELTPEATCTYVSGTNVGATADQSGELAPPGCASFIEGTTREVWYRATVPAGGAITFDMQGGTMTDGGMQVYRGTSCSGPLAPLACDDNGSSNANMPKITVTGQIPNTVIFVRVWSKNGTLGTFGICATIPAPAPPNDDPCGAIELPVGATCSYQTFTNASASNTTTVPAPVCAGYQGGDVWFKVIVPPATTALVFDTQTGTVLDGGMAVYSGSSCTSTLLIRDCDDNSSANGAMPRLTVGGFAPGDTVWVRIWENGNNNNGTFGICVTLPPPPPANDDPCIAIEVPVQATCSYQTFTTRDATASSPIIPAPDCADYSGGDVWFRVVVPAGGAVVFDSQVGVVTDGAMAVYTGTCNNLALIACNDDASSNGAMPKITLGGLTPGDTLWVRFWENGNNNNGTFGFCAAIPPPPPANDEVCNAIELTADVTCNYTTFTNMDATASIGVPDPGCANYAGGDVWFKVVVPAEGGLVFDSQVGVITDGGMAVYSGTCNNLNLLACNDDASANGAMPRIALGGLTPGDTVWVRFWELGNDGNGTFGICATIPPPPPANDESCNAIELTPDITCNYTTFSNQDATGSTGAPDPDCANYAGGDVWFKVVVPAEGALAFDTQEDVMEDGGMALYSGNACAGTLTLLTCDDNSSVNGDMPSLTVGGLTPSDTIWVRIWANGNEGNGTFGLCVSIPPPAPTNDDPCNAVELIPGLTCNYQTFTNESATNTLGAPDPECANYQGGDVWFKVLVPAEGGLIFDSQTGVITDAGMALYTGSCNNLTLLDCNDDGSVNGAMPFLTAFGLTPGDTIFVRFWEYGGDENGTFGICVRVPPPPPVNDNPCNSIELIVNPTCTYQTFTNESATDSPDAPEPDCANYSGADVWFKAVVPAGGTIVFDTEDHDMTDGGMAVYSGTCAGLSLLACDDDASSNGAMPKITLGGLNPGDTLYVRMWSPFNDNNGTFGICASIPPPPPSNDDPCTAIVLTPDSVCNYQTFTNENATNSTGVPEPGCANYQGGDVWFSVIVPSGGALDFDGNNDGAISDGGMAIYSGTCGNLTLIDCDDDGSDNGAMPFISAGGLTPGDTIWVRMWEYGGDENGTFGICVRLPPPGPVNDDPCNAIEIPVATACAYQTFTNESAFGSAGVPAPDCANYQGGDVWFKAVVPAEGAITFDTRADVMDDGGMAVYMGNCGNLTLIDCNDNDGAGDMPKMTVGGLTAGDTVWIRIWDNGNFNSGTFGLCATIPPPPPSNDNPCGAIVLTATDSCNYQTFSNEGSFGTASVPAPDCGDYEGADVWFQVTAPAAGALNINTQAGTIIDGGMAVYTADSCTGTFTLIGCDDNGSSNPDMPYITATGVTPGSTLWIRVWSNGGAASAGTFGICAVIPPLQPATFSFSCARDTSFSCGGGDSCFTLDAVIPNIHALTDRYAINPLSAAGCFNPYVAPGTEGPSTDLSVDDTYTEVINLPFSFPFFGSNYNSLIASTNGYISFDVTEAGNFSHWDIVEDDIAGDPNSGTPRNLPTPDGYYDRALVMGPYHDLNPFYTTSPTQRIKYNVTGTAPHRRWILSFYRVPLFTDFGGGCDELIENTHQIVLYEGTGVIEVFLFDMQNCLGWNQGRAMVGIQDFSRTRGYMAPGRAASDAPWGRIGMNESWRFVPVGGPTLFKRVELFDTSGNFLATGDTTSLDEASLKVNFTNLCALNRLPAGLNTLLVRATYQKFDDPTQEEVGADTITIFIPNLKVNFEVKNGQCSSLGSVSVHTTTGVAPFRFSSDSGVTWQTDSSFADLTAGTYYFKVQDGAGCARDTIITIDVVAGLPLEFTTTNPSCSGDNATVVVTPQGVWPIRYSLDGGTTYQYDSTFTLGAGTYNFHVVDTNGCAGDSVIVITVPLPISGTYADSAVHCNGGSDGTISVVSVSGGTAPYSYSFDSSPYSADSSVSAFAAGPHTVSIRDANGCIKDTTIVITEPAPLSAVYADSAALCNGSANGIISVVSVSGGTAPFTYSFDSNPYGADTTASNFAAGPHTISIRDANGCTKDTTIVITEPAPMFGVYADSAALCNGSANGIISVISVSGGAGPFTYSFDNSPYSTDSSLSTFAAGPHLVSIRDANGCTKDTTIIVTEPAPIVASYTVHSASCTANGSIIVTVTGGGTSPFDYSSDGGNTYQTADSLSLPGGTYTVRIRDARGCTKDSSIEVQAPPAITAVYAVNQVKCFAANSGSIIITAAGGTPGYEYSVDGGTGYQADDSFAVAAGTYAVRIRDLNGCTKDTSIIVTQPDQLQATASAGNTGCNTTTPTGDITVTATGGTPAYTYSSDGLNFQPGNSFTGLTQNNYTITVTDANGCTVTTAAVVGVVNDLTLQTRQDTTICTEIAVGLYTTTNAQTITWAGPNLSSTSVASPTASPTAIGTAEYTVVAQTGTCIVRDTVRIIVTAPPTVYAGDGAEVTKGQDATIRNASVGNGVRFEWSPATYLNNANTLSPTVVRPQETITYMLTAFNAEGCSSSDTVTVTVIPYCIKVKNAFTPNGDGVNDNWMVYDQFDCLQNVTVQVFNRYGSRVFESKNYRNDWTGTYNGSSLPDATYYYVIDFKLTDGRNYQVRGDVTILR